jgi:[ribosomal protein S18]-alanine N-acetyltransferase
MSPPESEVRDVIRELGAHDLDALADLHAACFSDAWDVDALATLLAMPGSFALLAVGRGPGDLPDLRGFVMVRAIAGEAEIISLGVRPSLRRAGLGHRLLAAASREAVSCGARRLFLEVAEDNAAARALYRAAGLADVGRRPKYYQRADGDVAALVLARDLHGGNHGS